MGLPRGRRPVTKVYADTKPDLDKLTRSVLDSLTDAGIFTDDSRVVAIDACKITSVGRDGMSGVYVGVKPMEGA